MAATYLVLAAAVASLWLGGGENAPPLRRHAWLALAGASLAAGLVSGVVTSPGAAWVALIALAVWCYYRLPLSGVPAVAAAVLVLALAAGLSLHVLPGFHNLRVISAARFTPDAVPFTLYLNYDKTVVGLFILGWGHSRLGRMRDWRTMAATAAPWAAGLLVLVLALSLAAGYVRLAPKFPAESWLWLGVNLGFTCLAEEALFRGFIQAQLTRAWAGRAGGRMAALGVAAVLFGLAHYAGGAAYVALAAVAGAGYGWIYRRTGRIEASIFTHFGLNTVHFFLFTYPALAR